MQYELKITILVDNITSSPDLETEHGLSMWIEYGSHRILFDTGQSSMLVRNAEKLGIDLSTADILILSHGHYDHTGGISSILALNPDIKIFCHPSVFVPRYSRQPDGAMKPIGMPGDQAASLNERFDKIRWVRGPLELSESFGITGPVPRINNLEDTGGSFFLDADARQIDPVTDDLSLWFRTQKGLCIVCGCCHSGLINTVSYIHSLVKDEHIHSITGGFHLRSSSAERINATCDYIQYENIAKIIPCHCTGSDVVSYMQTKLGKSVIAGEAGKVLKIK